MTKCLVNSLVTAKFGWLLLCSFKHFQVCDKCSSRRIWVPRSAHFLCSRSYLIGCCYPSICWGLAVWAIQHLWLVGLLFSFNWAKGRKHGAFVRMFWSWRFSGSCRNGSTLQNTCQVCAKEGVRAFFNLASINSYFENYGTPAFWKVFGWRGPKQNERRFRSCSVGWDCAEVKPGGGGERR